ncbi:hypothetical protein FNF31_01120 [Cafeteria roenbergensis]|uniref:TOG domain-containing protein n=2 Tax=Cafeteria roenbergensis TaxID=33653 RepID=A0A5A8DMV9_CAFRO|nr:hypothetical protein FNF31_01120 [Cafeteria roenbergensis]
MLAVRRHAPALAAYYLKQAASRNHNLRITACHVIGELGQKLPAADVAGQAESLVRAVVGALDDARWHVRAAACGALVRWVEGPSGDDALRVAGLVVAEAGASSAAGAGEARLDAGLMGQLIELCSGDAWEVRELAADAVAAVASRSPPTRAAVLAWAGRVLGAASDGASLTAMVRAASSGESSPMQATLREEPPDVDYDSDGGRDDDLDGSLADEDADEDAEAEADTEAASRGSPSAGGGRAARRRRWCGTKAGEAGEGGGEDQAPAAAAGGSGGAQASAGGAETAGRAETAQGAAMVVAAMAPGLPDGAQELGGAVAELARRAAGMGPAVGPLVTSLLRSLRHTVLSVGGRAAKRLVAPACEAAVAALGMEAGCPAAGAAGRSLVAGLRTAVGAAAFEARLEPHVRAVLSREGLLEAGAGMPHPSMDAAMSVRTAETGTFARPG